MDGHQLVRMTARETRAAFWVQKSWLPVLCRPKLHNGTMASVHLESELRKNPSRSSVSILKCMTEKAIYPLLSLYPQLEYEEGSF